MATKLAQVRVTPVEAGLGYLITCNLCRLREARGFRGDADQLAAQHQRDHVAGTAVTQHADTLGGVA